MEIKQEFSELISAGSAQLSAAPLGEVTGNRSMLRLLLKHLVDNAFRYNANASACCTVSRDGGSLVVRDNGSGVPEEDGQLVYEILRRGRNSAGTAGFGMGLAVARAVMEFHGGTLNHTNIPGDGVEFRAVFPEMRTKE